MRLSKRDHLRAVIGIRHPNIRVRASASALTRRKTKSHKRAPTFILSGQHWWYNLNVPPPRLNISTLSRQTGVQSSRELPWHLLMVTDWSCHHSSFQHEARHDQLQSTHFHACSVEIRHGLFGKSSRTIVLWIAGSLVL